MISGQNLQKTRFTPFLGIVSMILCTVHPPHRPMVVWVSLVLRLVWKTSIEVIFHIRMTHIMVGRLFCKIKICVVLKNDIIHCYGVNKILPVSYIQRWNRTSGSWLNTNICVVTSFAGIEPRTVKWMIYCLYNKNWTEDSWQTPIR